MKVIFKSFKEIIRLLRMLNLYPLFSEKEREVLPFILSEYQNDIDPELKLKVYELLLELRHRLKKKFGLIIVLGWRKEWNEKYAAIADSSQNIFKDKHFDLKNCSLKQCYEVFKNIVDFDGAILVNKDGLVLASGVYLDNVHPKQVAKILNPAKAEDLSSAFGFMKKVHTRHLAAIAASYILKNTTVYVVSEEDRSLRIFERGRIIWSTNKSEIKKIIDEKKV